MGWRFRKSIRVIPGVRINLSAKGVSTTIGGRGASVNFSSRGTYVNAGIPGTGISYRAKVGGSNRTNLPAQPNLPSPQPEYLDTPSYETSLDNIITLNIEEVTSQDMQGIKQALVWAYDQRQSLGSDIETIKRSLSKTETKLFWGSLVLLKFWGKSIHAELVQDKTSQQEAISVLGDSIGQSLMTLNIEFDSEMYKHYSQLLSSFNDLCLSDKIWDITSSHENDTFKTRSAANTVISRKEVKINRANLPEIACEYEAMHFQNANGADIYIYPDFIISFNSIKEFGIIGFHEIDVDFESSHFLEEGTIPSDTKTIGQTWAKVNKNGLPDMRFKENYQIPIVQYGSLAFSTSSGFNEAFQFSNYEHALIFSLSLKNYQSVINSLKHS